ncbi:MAG: hypothetical protein GYA62_04790, partial [Bacteroidales bacterium]|nr:hypothetical protein [Bacteroidales bacterium]
MKKAKTQFVNARVNVMNASEQKACEEIIFALAKMSKYNYKILLYEKKKASEKYKITMISNPMLLVVYQKLVKNKKIKRNIDLEELFRKRRIRTSSGIASVAVLTKPFPCPGKCVYCPTQENVPKSYIDNEPAVMRAILAGYDPVKQMQIRLRGFELAGNPADKIELIVMGGTFSYLPRKYQVWFILSCFMAANHNQVKSEKLKVKSKNLKLKIKTQKQLLEMLRKEQKKNEKAKYRIIGLTLETRP